MRGWLRPLLLLAGTFALAMGLAWLLFAEWLHAPPAHVRDGLGYLARSGAAALLLGSALVLPLSRYLPRLSLTIAAACIAGSGAGIVMVGYLPLLMFENPSDLKILQIALLFSLIISLAFAFLIGMAVTRQLGLLRQGAVAIAGGDLTARVPVLSADEVAELAQGFNRMAAELDAASSRSRALEEERWAMLAAISHDLRTPLASIRAMTEAINDRIVTDEDTVRRYQTLIAQESAYLGRLIDDLFELVRIESGNLTLHPEPVPLGELVHETVDALQIHARTKGVRLEAADGVPIPPISVDGRQMQRVLVNLVGNAIRYTPEGGEVRVAVGRQNGDVRIAVQDTGEGIAAEHQPYVFDRFYRGDKSRSRDTGGAGLGLSIARGIVEAHGGTIRVESEQGQGATFVVELPGGAR